MESLETYANGLTFDNMTSQPRPDDIADCVLKTFNAVPAKFKPRQLADGRREWVPLAGIVLSKGEVAYSTVLQTRQANSCFLGRDHDPSSFTCVSLATGMKCLPRDKVPLVRGSVLHDWHAEVLCLRGFNRWIVDACAELVAAETSTGDGKWFERNHDGEGKPPFSLHHDVKIHMYCSEAPCGDASMELTMAAQDDATPWSSIPDGMLGRGHFDQLGVVRRKPSRPDAPICWSKSCSDKIALKQCVGLLSGLGSLLVRPCFLDTLVLPKAQCVAEAVERAFGASGRMKYLVGLEGKEEAMFRTFTVQTTEREFDFSKHATSSSGAASVPSNLSTLWTPNSKEVLINGVLQGRKQMDPKGASCTCRRRMWQSVLEVAVRLDSSALMNVLTQENYGHVKDSQLLQERAIAKSIGKEKALKGWKRNDGDEDWSL